MVRGRLCVCVVVFHPSRSYWLAATVRARASASLSLWLNTLLTSCPSCLCLPWALPSSSPRLWGHRLLELPLWGLPTPQTWRRPPLRRLERQWIPCHTQPLSSAALRENPQWLDSQRTAGEKERNELISQSDPCLVFNPVLTRKSRCLLTFFPFGPYPSS